MVYLGYIMVNLVNIGISPKKNICWLVVYLPLWEMMEFVNGKDDIPYIYEMEK